MWRELDAHKEILLEQEQEKEKQEESLSIGDFMDMFKEKSIELEKYIDDKEYQKELKERIKANEELEREEEREKYVPPIKTPTPIKSVEKKKEEKKIDEEEKPRLNAVEMAIINQRESERLRKLELQKIAEDNKKKQKITYWEDDKNKGLEKE